MRPDYLSPARIAWFRRQPTPFLAQKAREADADARRLAEELDHARQLASFLAHEVAERKRREAYVRGREERERAMREGLAAAAEQQYLRDQYAE